jgi:hypothetical protein
MSDVSSGARSPNEPYSEPLYPATETYVAAEPISATTYPPETSTHDSGGDDSKAKQVASQATHAAGQAAGDVKDTVQEQARNVGAEAKTQARNVASDVRDRVSEQARTQNDKLVGSIRQTADQLDEMRGERTNSPAATVVSRVADGGRQLADYLDRNGPEGVLQEVQDFARRRPGAFLATALAAGFVVGRLGKGVAKADPAAGADDKPSTDSFVSSPTPAATYPDAGSTGYAPGPVSTEYTATGTGTPLAVDQEYVNGDPGGRP